MKMNLLAGTAFILAAASWPVWAQDQLELTLDAYVAMIKAQGGQFDFSAKNVGGDGSVEYRDLKFDSGDGSFGIDAQWLRATPDGEMVTLTWAPTVTINMASAEAAGPSSVTVTSENLALKTNAIVPDPTILTKFDVTLDADLLQVGDLKGENAYLSDLDVKQEGLSATFSFDAAVQKAEGSWNAALIDAAYGMVAEGMENTSDLTVSGLKLNYSFDIPNETNIPDFLKGAKNFSASFSADASTGKGTTSQEGVAFAYESSGGPSSALLELVNGLATYSVKGVDATMILTPQGMPMPPINVAMKEVGMDMIVPFNAVDAPGQATAALKFIDVSVGEELWSMIDPGQSIPRDPLNIDINLTSSMQFIGDYAAMVAGQIATPTEMVKVDDLSINSFLIAVAGASVNGVGKLAFDNNGPVPLPTGKLNLEVLGAQSLSTKLTELGLVDATQSGMAMGMMMSFGKSEEGGDKITSEIEFLPDGSVTANGQPLPM